MIPLGRNEPQNFVNTNKINQTSIVVLFLISMIFFSYHIIVDWSVFLLKQCSIVAPLILFPGSTTNCAIILKGIAENTAFYLMLCPISCHSLILEKISVLEFWLKNILLMAIFHLPVGVNFHPFCL